MESDKTSAKGTYKVTYSSSDLSSDPWVSMSYYNAYLKNASTDKVIHSWSAMQMWNSIHGDSFDKLPKLEFHPTEDNILLVNDKEAKIEGDILILETG
jgi:hypothetical protein